MGKVSIRKELAKAGVGILTEMKNQVFGSLKKKGKRGKSRGGGSVHISYHFHAPKNHIIISKEEKWTTSRNKRKPNTRDWLSKREN